jgi:hypothetical protein
MNVWEYNQGYIELWANNRVIPAAYNDVLYLTNAFPPGYKVSDGVTPGGVYPTNQTPSSYPIVLWPENNGTGPYRFKTEVSMVVQNNSSGTAFFAANLGVAFPSGPVPANQPMWPYLGVAHVADGINTYPLMSLQPRETKYVVIQRMDLVSNLFLGPGGVAPNWPMWQVETCQTPGLGLQMYPGVCISFRTTTEAVTVGEIQAIGMMDSNV